MLSSAGDPEKKDSANLPQEEKIGFSKEEETHRIYKQNA